MTVKLFKIWLAIFFVAVSTACSENASSDSRRSDSAFQIPIALEGSLQNPAWSPDGKFIVFTRFRNGYNEDPADLVIYEFEGEKVHLLVSDGNDNINLPGSAWNRITDNIVFSSSREPHDEIFSIHANDTVPDEDKVTDRAELVAYEPSISPDGQLVVFESHRVDVEDNGVIMKYKIDGTEAYQTLTDINDDCRQPNWSPDGNHILYQTNHSGRWEIWIMNTDGTNERQITSGSGDKTDASFSPDGQWIVYSGDNPSIASANLFMLATTGGSPKQVTYFNGYDGAPSWSPDGRQIIFESSNANPEDTLGTTIWMIHLDN